MKKLNADEKSPTFFVVMGICVQRKLSTKMNLTCGVFSIFYKKDCSGTAYIEFGKFLNNQKHNHPKSFAAIEKTKIEAKTENESERSTLAPRDIYNKNINPNIFDISTFLKLSSIMRERRANKFPPTPRIVENFDKLLKNPDFGKLKAISVTEQALPLKMKSR